MSCSVGWKGEESTGVIKWQTFGSDADTNQTEHLKITGTENRRLTSGYSLAKELCKSFPRERLIKKKKAKFISITLWSNVQKKEKKKKKPCENIKMTGQRNMRLWVTFKTEVSSVQG